MRDRDSGVGFATVFHTDLQVEVVVSDREVAGQVGRVDALDVRVIGIDAEHGNPSSALLEECWKSWLVTLMKDKQECCVRSEYE